jgi:hypothetical protein
MILLIAGGASAIGLYESTRKNRFPYLACIYAIPLCIILACALTSQENAVIGNSELVITIKDTKGDQDTCIYFDADADKYFRKDINDWNPFHMYYRTYLDKTEVEEYLEYQKQIEKIDLLD